MGHAKHVSEAERRRAARFPALLSVHLNVAAEDDASAPPNAAVISNISRSGIFVATPRRAALGQTVFFRFAGPKGECMAIGNVIANRGELGFAVEFQGESLEMKEFFDLLEKLKPAQLWQLLQALDRAEVEIV